MSSRARSFRKPKLPRSGTGGDTTTSGTRTARPARAASRPASRSACGACACPRARPEPSKHTPVKAIFPGPERPWLLARICIWPVFPCRHLQPVIMPPYCTSNGLAHRLRRPVQRGGQDEEPGWRYHHSFGVLGILISRVTGRPLGEHLAEDIFGPLGMTDTALWVPESKLDRLPAAYRHGDEGLVETEPAGGGFYAGPPSFDVSHGELVSTARDYHRFARMLADGGRADGQPMISPEHHRQMTSDQVPS